MKMKTYIFLMLFLATALDPMPAFSQPADQAQRSSIFERLTATDGIQLTLSTNVSALIADKKMQDYQPAVLTTPDGTSIAISVKPRGKFRRRISPIPPLKLKIKKKWLESEGLDTLNELKLVLPTSLDRTGDELVVREYLVYRMFEQASPYSIRARLVDLTLLNTGLGNEPRYTVKAILLEDEEELAARLEGQLVEQYGLTADSLDPAQAALTAMFQYMIGNTDWNVAEFRNLRMLRLPNGALTPVPFDFDFCGFVNAPYATPTSGLGIRSVRERFIQADGLRPEALSRAIDVLQNCKQGFYDLCRNGQVAAGAGEKLVQYLESFFREPQAYEKGK